MNELNKAQKKVLFALVALSESGELQNLSCPEIIDRLSFADKDSLKKTFFFLESLGYIDSVYQEYSGNDTISILPKALVFKNSVRRERLRFWLPTVIAAIGAVAAIVSAIFGIVQVLTL